MFSYVDSEIRQCLEEGGKLVHVTRDGKPVRNGIDEPYLSLLGPIPMPRMIRGEERVLSWYAFVRRVELGHVLEVGGQVASGEGEAFRELLQSSMSVNSVLACPGFLESAEPLVRIHSCCMTGDVFGSMRCECGPQLNTAFEKILDDADSGAVIYMSGHEGRGIGLWAKAVTYLLQDAGQDTYEANASLGLPEDSRNFDDAAVVLKYFMKGRPIRLLSNNPLKRHQLEENGQPVSRTVELLTGVSEHNRRYLESKREKGHRLPEKF